ncbi:hypothetical protein [Roseivivax sp. CAU 1753]
MQAKPSFWQKNTVCYIQRYGSYGQVAMPATLSSNQLFAIPLLQHRFHFVQAIHGGAHLRLIHDARSISIRNLASKIHLHLTLFLGDDGLNDGRGFFWNAVILSVSGAPFTLD